MLTLADVAAQAGWVADATEVQALAGEVAEKCAAVCAEFSLRGSCDWVPAKDDAVEIAALDWKSIFAARLCEVDPRWPPADGEGVADQFVRNGRFVIAEPGREATDWFAKQGALG